MPGFPGSIILFQTTNVHIRPWHIFLLSAGFWENLVGCFLPQALDWIQETGEYYLSTHTSTGETTEETQELLKEYGEFRVPAKVGSILEPSPSTQHIPFWPFSHCEWENSLCTEMLDHRANGGHVGRIISFEIWTFKEMQLLGRALYTGSQLLYAVLLNGPHLCAPGSGICCVLLDQIQQRNVFMWNAHCVYEYQPHTLEIWMAWEVHLLRRASGYGWLHKADSRTISIWPCPANELGWGPWGAKHTLVYVPTSSHPHSHWMENAIIEGNLVFMFS